MKDYLVHINDHAEELTCNNWSEALRQAASYRRMGFTDVTIDQYKNSELTGVYWTFNGNKIVRHG